MENRRWGWGAELSGCIRSLVETAIKGYLPVAVLLTTEFSGNLVARIGSHGFLLAPCLLFLDDNIYPRQQLSGKRFRRRKEEGIVSRDLFDLFHFTFPRFTSKWMFVKKEVTTQEESMEVEGDSTQ